MNRVLITLTLIFSWAPVNCQPVIDASICEEDAYPFINEYMEHLTHSSILTLDEVLTSEHQKNFKPVGQEPVIYHGYDPYFYWYRFVVDNNEDVSKDLVLLTGSLGMRTSELYQLVDGKKISLGKAGYSHAFESRSYLHSRYAYTITLLPKSRSTFYFFVDESHAFKTFAFGLFHPKAMKKSENKFYFSFGLMIGLLALFLLFNFYLYLSNGDKIHFWYAFYIGIQIFMLFKHEGLDAEFLGMDGSFAYRSTSMAAVGGFSVAMLLHVVQLFITAIQKSSIPYKIMMAVKWLLFMISGLQLLSFYIEPAHEIEWAILRLSTNFTSFGLIAILIYCIYSIIKGFQFGWYVVIALSLFLIGGIERTMFLTSKSHLLPPSLFEIGMVVETIIISFGLMYRYQLSEKERNRIAKELQEQKFTQAKELILVQEEERKRIASDLHDDLGSNLAVMKLHLQSADADEEQKRTLIDLLDNTSHHVRQVSHNLMPPEFINTKMEDILHADINKLSEESGIHFEYIQSGYKEEFSKDEELMIYRIIMELCNNILRHSKAQEATIQLIYQNDALDLIIEDDGKGFDNKDEQGIGLKNIRSRTEYLKGHMNIDSSPHGTTIIISLPYKQNEHGDEN